MYGKYPSKEALIENLRDAGCNTEQIEKFLHCLEEEQTAQQLSLLDQHRQCLLTHLHKEEKCIDCLDYLLYHMQRAQKPSEKESGERPKRPKNG